MAIYHLHAKMVKRSEGRSSVGAAAYRSGTAITDERTGHLFDYTDKPGVEHTEIIAPEGAAAWVHDRAVLWNTVERVERRKDAQVAREIEIALPVELSKDQQVELMRDFVTRTFVSQGMVGDFAIHRDNLENPHAHLLLTTRTLTETGFGWKRRDWNAKTELLAWRSQWAEIANEHLVRAGLDLRIDHRTLEAQHIDLVPGRKIGLSLERQQEPALPRNLSERVAEAQAIAAENGERLRDNPGIALKAITHSQATFTERDIAKYLHTRTDGAEQFQAVFLKVTTSEELVALGRDEQGAMRYTTREMLDLERKLLERGTRLASAREHLVSAAHREQELVEGRLSAQQREAFEHVTAGADLVVVVGVAGAGKSTMLGAARRAWEAQGLTVKGGALSGIAAENLEHASGITSRTLASLELAWRGGREPLTHRDVLVIDEAGLVGTRQLAGVLERAEAAHAKVVLVGDPEQLQAIEAGAPFRGLASQAGMTELSEVRRQKVAWQKEATQQLAHGRTREALTAYERAQHIEASPTREAAREAMLAAWQRAGQERPSESRLMLAYTRDDVQALNARARELRAAAGELGKGEVIETERGAREFAAGDRLYFLRNERSLGVKNGSLGTVEALRGGVLQVRLDGEGERRVAVDTRFYAHLDHGYAATVYKAQGTTVDHTFVLATSHFDRHSTYVALSRHRESAAVFYGQDDFRGDFKAVLSRARPKALAHDYLDRSPGFERSAAHGLELAAEASAPTSSQRLTPAERFRQRVEEAAQRLAHERETERPAREALQRRRALEQYQALERQLELVKEQQRVYRLRLERDHGPEL
ncbi:MAG: Ti-type conjugative transfer relaxase TraA [Steroidobacteraceae bacterium]